MPRTNWLSRMSHAGRIGTGEQKEGRIDCKVAKRGQLWASGRKRPQRFLDRMGKSGSEQNEGGLSRGGGYVEKPVDCRGKPGMAGHVELCDEI